jgi:hypothetical protein
LTTTVSKTAGTHWILIGRVVTGLILLVALLVGFWLRVPDLERLPPGLFSDEGVYSLDGWQARQDGNWRVFYSGNKGREPIYILLLGLAFQGLGPSAWAARLVSVFAGVVAVAGVYRLTVTALGDGDDARPMAGMSPHRIAAGSDWPRSRRLRLWTGEIAPELMAGTRSR